MLHNRIWVFEGRESVKLNWHSNQLYNMLSWSMS